MNAGSDADVAPSQAATALALVGAARRLHALWVRTSDAQARVDLAIAATLAAHAAIDALLPDETRTGRIRDRWRTGSVLVRAARVTARLDEPLPPDLESLCAVRHALGRSGEGADAPHARAWLRGDGVARAAALVDRFERLCASRPD